ncbi:hypothetical protein [Streptomyces sp. SAI-127]|nr:hypothetical protein [Streptomyces sp. SAI-127]MDH6489612.1 hypothetical protein [Streptomyces sp. SAI-127]
MTEQEKARQAYAAGREQRDGDAVQMGQDNARIDGAATGTSNQGGAR